ncbi:hypothetical protein SALBM311S_10185 [Streptomyces alboniger]
MPRSVVPGRRVGAAQKKRWKDPRAVTDTPADDPKPSFRSDVTVELVKHTASDADALFASPSDPRRAVPGRSWARTRSVQGPINT